MKSMLSLLLLAVLCSAVAVAQSSYSQYGNNGTSNYSQNNLITNGPVAETVSSSSAFIGWSTQDPAQQTTVKYGTKRDHLTRTAHASTTDNGKNHHARLENLSPDTTYYFQVMANGEPLGGIGTFRTVEHGQKPIQSKAIISQK